MEKLQYISRGFTREEQELNIRKALDNGVKWVQVRWKEAPDEKLISLCEVSKKLCLEYQATCIVNDSVQTAKEVDADGVHLGLEDLSVQIARYILGENKIIGGTANTILDVLQRIDEQCDYIGLGPLRFTSTKDHLNPILGFEGYRKIVDKLKNKSIEIPKIYAIGGVIWEDLEQLQEIGVYGVAVSGQITNKPSIVNEFKKILK